MPGKSGQEQRPVSGPGVVPQVPARRSPRGPSRLLEALGRRQQEMRVGRETFREQVGFSAETAVELRMNTYVSPARAGRDVLLYVGHFKLKSPLLT